MYLSAEQGNICLSCELPCADCKEDSTSCTACHPESELPVVYEGVCIEECPVGTTSEGGVCEDC